MTRPDSPRVMAPPEKPLLVFDGDCTFCRFWIQRWRSISGDLLDYAPYQEVASRFPEIDVGEFRRAVQLVLPTGEVFAGAAAVVRALAEIPGRRHWLALYRIPGVSALVDVAYGLIARHRGAAMRVTRLLWGDVAAKPTYSRAGCLFVRLVALCYFAAFVSLWIQVEGLIGPRGILPADRYLDWVRANTGAERFWLVPTLAWFSAAPGMLHVLCAAGAAVSIGVLVGFAPTLGLAAAWLSYLSLSSISQQFLGYQWDALLLEAGLLAIFLFPPSWRLRPAAGVPSEAVRRLLLWLLFRLMFSSGAVKLGSGDPTWRSLTALQYHYETQPLPTWVGWFFHQLPASFHTVSCAVLLLVELVVPFLVFLPRRGKHLAFALLVALQILIALTGNYAFFNLLAVALCVLLIDDAAWPVRRTVRTTPVASRAWPLAFLVPFAAVILLASTIQLALTLRRSAQGLPRAAIAVIQWIEPFRSVNRYGLFAIMTTRRPEILVEGSDDGQTWKSYEFRWKPGDLQRRPAFVAPHQPRIDWQMWFAALGSCEENPWFVGFLGRLLQGEPAVLRLLRTNPFPAGAPRFVRASLYDYRFTDRATRRSTGTWWRREPQGLYCPVVSREMLRGSGRSD